MDERNIILKQLFNRKIFWSRLLLKQPLSGTFLLLWIQIILMLHHLAHFKFYRLSASRDIIAIQHSKFRFNPNPSGEGPLPLPRCILLYNFLVTHQNFMKFSGIS